MVKRGPTERTMRALRKDGWLVEKVERWNPYGRVRQDLFGFIDVLAVKDGEVLAVQCTTASNLSRREQKVRNNPNTSRLLEAGWTIEIHGWVKRKRTGRWECVKRVVK